jgi:DNA-binding NarL/FixJ family response regulator
MLHRPAYSERVSGRCLMSDRSSQASGAPQAAAGRSHDDLRGGRADLSERELEIIELVAEGLTNQEIAVRLTISKRTVDNHVSNIFTKTGAKNRVALLNWAMDHGKICRDGFNCCSLDDGRKAG